MNAPDTPLHTVVVPVYNEVEGIEQFHVRCSAALMGLGDRHEIIYVDDGSRDGSWDLLLSLSERDDHVRLVRLSRNFGHQVAISAGIAHAEGDTVTVMDADLQDPPEVIVEFVAHWRAGADVVYGVRRQRKSESWFKLATAKIFYRSIRMLADVDMPLDVGDFRLLSRRAAEALMSMPEHHRYVRGMVAWLGFDAEKVEYVRDARFAGQTKYSLARMIRFASDGIFAFSMRPLRLATWLGLLTSAAAFITAVALIVVKFEGNFVVQGWTWLALLILLFSGVQLLTIGVLGEYMGRIYAEVQQRPMYLVRELHGFPTERY